MLEQASALHLMMMRQLVPLRSDGCRISLGLKSLLVSRELVNKSGSDLEIGPSTIQELQGLQQTPPVLLHDEGC